MLAARAQHSEHLARQKWLLVGKSDDTLVSTGTDLTTDNKRNAAN